MKPNFDLNKVRICYPKAVIDGITEAFKPGKGWMKQNYTSTESEIEKRMHKLYKNGFTHIQFSLHKTGELSGLRFASQPDYSMRELQTT